MAKHPKTGATIRIMRSEASVWRSEKTLVWLKDQDPSLAWERWETLAIGFSDIHKWAKAQKRIDYAVFTESTPDSVDLYIAAASSGTQKMIFITKEIIFAIGVDKFRSMRLPNVIVLEEMHQMYPFLSYVWDGSDVDAAFMVAAVIRMPCLSAGFQSMKEFQRVKTLETNGLTLRFLDEEQPKKLWFITQYYKPEKARREKEIRECLQKNIECSIIDKIVLLNEKNKNDLPKSDKIQEVVIGKRLTYKHVFQWIHDNVPDDVICVFANADIYLDTESWRDAWAVKMNDVFMALLRWDVQANGESKLFGPRNDSQDTWAVLSTSVKNKTWDWDTLDFQFGTAGCDNAITVELLRKRFLVVNPSITLKTHHLHLTGIRGYDPSDVIPKPVFLYVEPTGVHDMDPVLDLSQQLDKKMKCESFSRELYAAQSRVLDVYCKMLERGDRYIFSSKDTNTFPETSVPIYKYKNVFQTPQGLVYGYNRLYIGNEEVSKLAWSKSRLSSITPAFKVKRTLVAPWSNDETKTGEGFLLHYLSKIMRLRNEYGDGEFWAPGESSTPLLELFRWNTRELPVIPHTENAQIWAEEAIQYPYLAKQEVHKEEIDALRQCLRNGWVETPNENNEKQRWAVMVDGEHITSEMVRGWEQRYPDWTWSVFFEGRTTPERIVEKLTGANGFICYGGPESVRRWGFSWVLPKNAVLIEVQNEMEPNGEAAHVSGAARLKHTLVIVPRASAAATKEAITKAVYLNLNSAPKTEENTLPVIRIPRSGLTGFFGHAGDSFREMVKLWEQKGYVRVVEDATAVQVWLGNVGDTLLYDRPTMDWLFAAPPGEQKWRKALFGNPKPSTSGGPSSSWFFWPRRPSLVEEAVARGLPEITYEQRVHNLVFYGKIENKVQEKRRKTLNWSTACDDYLCVDGVDTPYPFTPKQYLENLASAKFGLCLAGFGKKCHREVECMSMGCVPIVSADVDMENYAESPIEGIHYLRVKTPEEAKDLVASTSEETWGRMSAACRKWWKTNASAEGSWKLTEKLTAV